jgi:hypothetical protein
VFAPRGEGVDVPKDLEHPEPGRRRRLGARVHAAGVACAALSVAVLVVGSLTAEASPDDEGSSASTLDATTTASTAPDFSTDATAATSTTTPDTGTAVAAPPDTEATTTTADPPPSPDDTVVALDPVDDVCAASGNESVTTDNDDYPPESTVLVSGSGYGPGCRLLVEVTRPDGSIVRGDGTFSPGVDDVVTSAAGTFTYAYQLDGIEGTYRIRVLGDDGVSRATATFTDQLPRALPSDPRAIFVEANVVRCSEVGFPDSVQMGSPTNSSNSDGNVSGTVEPNSGPIQPGRGQEVNVAILSANVVIDAVVVKGSNGYNLYVNQAFLPPTLPPRQHYISPLTDGTNVPQISHWFVCYHFGTPPPPGALVVDKVVIPPDGTPIDPLPPGYQVTVTCDGQPLSPPLTFGPGGGVALPITGLPVGTVCTVEETTVLPPGSEVTYEPPDANTVGVTILADAAVTVDVVNDFSGLPVQTADVRVVKEVVQPVPPGVQLPSQYNVALECSDGTIVAVTLPGAGGPGTPATVPVAVGSLCGLQEDSTPLPPGWTVTYQVNGGTPQTAVAVFVVQSSADVVVTVVNNPTGAAPTTTTTTTVPGSTTSTTAAPATTTAPSTTAAASGGGAAGGGTLPTTGAGSSGIGFVAASILLFGLALVLLTWRDREDVEEAES